MFNRTGFSFQFNRAAQTTFKDMAVTVTATSSVYSKNRQAIINPFNRFGFSNSPIVKYKTFDYNADMTLHADVSAVGTMSQMECERGMAFNAHMHGESTFDAQYIRERLFKANMHGIANIYANFNRYTIRKLKYTGDVLSGDMIVIDMDRMTVTNNTINALKYFEGDFFELAPSHNELIYSDKETTRNVVLVTRYKDRWL